MINPHMLTYHMGDHTDFNEVNVLTAAGHHHHHTMLRLALRREAMFQTGTILLVLTTAESVIESLREYILLMPLTIHHLTSYPSIQILPPSE